MRLLSADEWDDAFNKEVDDYMRRLDEQPDPWYVHPPENFDTWAQCKVMFDAGSKDQKDIC